LCCVMCFFVSACVVGLAAAALMLVYGAALPNTCNQKLHAPVLSLLLLLSHLTPPSLARRLLLRLLVASPLLLLHPSSLSCPVSLFLCQVCHSTLGLTSPHQCLARRLLQPPLLGSPLLLLHLSSLLCSVSLFVCHKTPVSRPHITPPSLARRLLLRLLLVASPLLLLHPSSLSCPVSLFLCQVCHPTLGLTSTPPLPCAQAAAAAAAAGDAVAAPAPVKSVVFSQFVGMLDLVEGALTAEGIPFVRLDGKTSAANRRAAIRAFAGVTAGGWRALCCLCNADQNTSALWMLSTQCNSVCHASNVCTAACPVHRSWPRLPACVPGNAPTHTTCN
jgi:hypothetical protein